MLASAASARAHRHSIQPEVTAAALLEVVSLAVIMVLTMDMVGLMFTPMASLTTTLRLGLPLLHPSVGMLIWHAGQAPSLRCTKLPAVLV